jgi:hypothetical protein
MAQRVQKMATLTATNSRDLCFLAGLASFVLQTLGVAAPWLHLFRTLSTSYGNSARPLDL